MASPIVIRDDPKHDYETSVKTATLEALPRPFPGGGLEMGSGAIDYDVSDMMRLGKKQEFKVVLLWWCGNYLYIQLMPRQRNFSFLSTLGFISIYMATWEFVLVYAIENCHFPHLLATYHV